MADNTTTARFWECLRGDDLPLIVGIFVAVPSDLLACKEVRTLASYGKGR